MSFWDFLNWLYGVIDKVRAWFGTSFWTLYNGAGNALRWAIDEGTKAFNNAKAWVVTQAYAFSADVVNFVNNLSSRIVAAVNYAGIVATNAYNNAIAWASLKIQAAKDFAQGLVNDAKTWTQGALNTLGTSLTGTINAVRDFLLAQFGFVLTIKDVITAVKDLAGGNTYIKLKALVTSMFGTLSTLVTNPLGFITGMLFPIFTEVFCYALGYGLGAVESQLPPLPVWGTGGGGVYPPPGPPPPGTGQLVHPIDPIYVSGYTFTPPTHYGVDLGLAGGQSVYAMHNGVVQESGWSNVGYGNTIVLENDTWRTRYGHLQTCIVQFGQQVAAGQLIGYGNSTGNSTGNHLHLEVKLHGTFVDPLLYL